ncbi:MAG: CPBP family intramembrane metalloprotease [Chloroflexota bacterium]|nr:CPBP family intramembrane metalloprotease [Chloroflexota bacterium]
MTYTFAALTPMLPSAKRDGEYDNSSGGSKRYVTELGEALTAITLIGVFYGLSYWAYRARTDRSARVGLYILFGFPAILLLVAGIAAAFHYVDLATIVLAFGFAFGIALLKPVRQIFARFTPIDPDSPVDMTGLCVAFGLVALSLSSVSGGGGDVTSVSIFGLIANVITFVAVAYAAVGWWYVRSGREASARLGLVAPTRRTFPISVGFLFLCFAVAITGGLLAQVLQPGVTEDANSVARDIASDVQNPLGAIILGLSAGIGEELLFRGALQPRFGIVLTAGIFAVIHAQYGFNLVILGLFGIGIVLGLERKYFGTIAAILTHAMFNALVVAVQTSTN